MNAQIIRTEQRFAKRGERIHNLLNSVETELKVVHQTARENELKGKLSAMAFSGISHNSGNLELL
jgi:hypothetical protein